MSRPRWIEAPPPVVLPGPSSDGTVAAHFSITGTDLGGFRGRPATGNAITSWGVDFFDFSDGLIISNWVGIDWLGLLIQLGVIPDPWAG